MLVVSNRRLDPWRKREIEWNYGEVSGSGISGK